PNDKGKDYLENCWPGLYTLPDKLKNTWQDYNFDQLINDLFPIVEEMNEDCMNKLTQVTPFLREYTGYSLEKKISIYALPSTTCNGFSLTEDVFSENRICFDLVPMIPAFLEDMVLFHEYIHQYSRKLLLTLDSPTLTTLKLLDNDSRIQTNWEGDRLLLFD